MLKVTITGRLSKEKVKKFLEEKLSGLRRQLEDSCPELKQVFSKGLIKFEPKVEVSETSEAVEIFNEDSFVNATTFLQKAHNFYDNLSLQSKEVAGPDDALAKPVSVLSLSRRAEKIIARLGIETLGELVEKTEKDLLAEDGFGEGCLELVKDNLANLRLKLKAERSGGSGF